MTSTTAPACTVTLYLGKPVTVIDHDDVSMTTKIDDADGNRHLVADSDLTEATLTAPQAAALNVVEAGTTMLAMHTNVACQQIGTRTAEALRDRGLVRIWSRRDGREAVLPGSPRDTDLDGIGA